MDDVSPLPRLSWLVPVVWLACACRAPEPSPSSPAAPEPTRSGLPSDAGPSSPAPPEPVRSGPPPETARAAVPTASASAGANEPGGALRRVTSRQLASQPRPGRYLLDAYVVELRPCPACPPPLRCKPCPGDYIVVADEPTAPTGTATAMLLVTADQLRVLVAGARYRFSIEVHPAVGGGSGVNNMEVLTADGPLE